MDKNESGSVVSWDTPLALTITPAEIIHAVFGSATDVHTTWDSCIEAENILAEVTVADDKHGNYCRLIEQEYEFDEGDRKGEWHDWTVEIHLGEIYITGHWQVPLTASPLEWEWCERESSTAFTKGSVLFGRRVRPGGLIIEETFTDVASLGTQH